MFKKRLHFMQRNLKSYIAMGLVNSKDFMGRRKVDIATSNSSLSNMRYVVTEKPKWKVFKKKELVPLPVYRPTKGCPCGSDGPCKQKVTPKGVTLHYPQKKSKIAAAFATTKRTPPKPNNRLHNKLHFSFHMNDRTTHLNLSLPVFLTKNPLKNVKLPRVLTTNPLKDISLPEILTKNPLKNRDFLNKLKNSKKAKNVPERRISEFMFLPFMS